jgi:hypothetical protein
MRHRRFILGIAAFIRLLGFFLLAVSTCPAKAGDRVGPSCPDPRVKNCLCSSVRRKRHHFRHWIWSGIFPLEGGFIPDPHYICSEDGILPGPVNELIADKESRYAIVDVNPFFNDRSSEVLLLVKRHDEVFEYSLNFPKHEGVQAIAVEPEPPTALLFPYKTGLAALVNFLGPAKGAYVLPLPLKTKSLLELSGIGSPEFAEIAEAFKSIAQDRATKDQFCKGTNDFVAFYEKYSGPCDGRVQDSTEIEKNFAKFWLEK